jgi:Aspartyl protease
VHRVPAAERASPRCHAPSGSDHLWACMTGPLGYTLAAVDMHAGAGESRRDPERVGGRGRNGHGRVRADLTSRVVQPIGAALLWVLLATGSLAATLVALWVVLSLAKSAIARDAAVLADGPWIWLVAIVATIGLPLVLALWKHHGDPRGLSRAMVWLPLAVNGAGLLLASQVIPDVLGTALRGHAAWVAADRLGDSHAATRVLSALGHDAADRLHPGGAQPAAGLTLDEWTSEAGGQVDREKALAVPFTKEGTAILMDVGFDTPTGRIALPYLFDTGASFTTISSATASRLGVVVPEDAPMLTFNTASGPRESRMVFVPSMWLGDVHIRGLLASVCDGCVNERHHGLLGQNVMREFYAQIDFKNQRMVLLPRTAEHRPNRAYDIEPVTEVKVEGTAEVWLGRVRWVVQVRNRGTVPIRDVVPVVKFADGPVLRGKPIAEIAAGAVGRSLVEGRATLEGKGDSKGHYTLGLAEAFW